MSTPSIPKEIDEVAKLWPPQIISNHEFWFKTWWNSIQENYTRSSAQEYQLVGKRWIAYANGRDINPRLMLDWHLHILSMRTRDGNPFKPMHLKRHHIVVSRYLKWLKNCNVIAHLPTSFLPKPSTPAPLPPKAWKHSEHVAIMRYAEGRPEFQRIAWIWCLSYHTGMSMPDCCYLKWEDVKLRTDGPCSITIIRQKGRRRFGARAQCVIPILPGGELWCWLRRLEADRHEGQTYVHRETGYTYRHSRYYYATNLKILVAAAIGKENIKGRSFRHLRNSFCSRVINGGADSVMVSKMTGHTNLEQLAEYVVPDQRSMQEAIHKGLLWAENSEDEPPPSTTLINLPHLTVLDVGSESTPANIAPDTGGAANSVNQTKPQTQNE